MGKKMHTFSVRISDEEKESLKQIAKNEGLSVCELVRRRTIGTVRALKGDVEQPRKALTIYHVDQLGSDPLRLDNGALKR